MFCFAFSRRKLVRQIYTGGKNRPQTKSFQTTTECKEQTNLEQVSTQDSTRGFRNDRNTQTYEDRNTRNISDTLCTDKIHTSVEKSVPGAAAVRRHWTDSRFILIPVLFLKKSRKTISIFAETFSETIEFDIFTFTIQK